MPGVFTIKVLSEDYAILNNGRKVSLKHDYWTLAPAIQTGEVGADEPTRSNLQELLDRIPETLAKMRREEAEWIERVRALRQPARNVEMTVEEFLNNGGWDSVDWRATRRQNKSR